MSVRDGPWRSPPNHQQRLQPHHARWFSFGSRWLRASALGQHLRHISNQGGTRADEYLNPKIVAFRQDKLDGCIDSTHGKNTAKAFVKCYLIC